MQPYFAKDRIFELKEQSFNSACNKPNTSSVFKETWLRPLL